MKLGIWRTMNRYSSVNDQYIHITQQINELYIWSEAYKMAYLNSELNKYLVEACLKYIVLFNL